MSKKVIHSKPVVVRDQDNARKVKLLEKLERMDGWSNVVTLLGTSADKRTASKLQWEPHDPEFFEQMYAGGGIPARIVDLIPEHSLREWIKFQDVDDAQEEAMDERCQELDLRNVFIKAWKWGRAYGGGLIYIVTNTDDPSQPLQVGEQVLSLQDLARRDVRWMTTDVEYDMGSVNYGKPRIYYLNVQMGSQFKGYPVHWTRVVRFDGQLVPRITYIRNNYWHDSILNKPYNAIRNYETANDSAAAVLMDFNVDVFKMKNLANLISAGNEQIVKNRIETMAYVKSVLNAMLIDADNEEYENKSRELTGVADMLRVQSDRLVAETDIPHTILLGESPEGSNGTGNSTSQGWYNFIGAEQKNYAKPKLRRLFQIVFGNGVKFKFNPLRVLDDTEKADRNLKQAQADAIYIEKQVVDPSEIAESRFGGQEYSVDTQLDWEAREAGLLVPGGGSGGPDNFGENGGEEGEDPDDGNNEPPTPPGKKQPPQKKTDDVFSTTGDQPPEGKSGVATVPSEPEPVGEELSEEPDKDLHGFAEPGMEQVGGGVEAAGAGESAGTQYDLRNEEGTTEGTVPKTKSFIGQTESLPFRDPKTNPKMKGPGIPNKARTVLPTRGNGVTAQSGYNIKEDPKLQQEDKQGVEGHSIEPTLRADAHAVPMDDAWITMKGAHIKVSESGEHESGPFKGKSHEPKGAKSKGKEKPKPKKEGGGGEGPSALELLTKAAEKTAQTEESKSKDSLLDSGVEASMKEFAKGTLKSSSGKKVTDPKQAAAIGYSEQRGDSRAATVIVRNKDGHILMGPTHKDGRWTLPGGKVEDKESMHQGALRELHEETGIEASKLRYLGSRLVESEKGKNTHVAMYEHNMKDGVKPTAKKDPDKEVKSWKWFDTKDGLPKDVLGNLKHANNVALDHLGLLK